MSAINDQNLFMFNSMVLVIVTYIVFLCAVIFKFSARYLSGDGRKNKVLVQICLLAVSSILFVSANHFSVVVIFWCITNSLLISLMIHKSSWTAAQYSGRLALTCLGLSSCALATALLMIYLTYGIDSIQSLKSLPLSSRVVELYLLLIICVGMAQSALWPFHRWLLSSANSPTPVCAIMHAGVINGGGILLAKFAPAILMHPHLLVLTFIVGLISALLGTGFLLIQTDIKRYLACSTLSQMGFMTIQCGLGLFPAALAHICYHGLFKAYLFLSIGNLSRTTRVKSVQHNQSLSHVVAFGGGLWGGICFAYVTGKPFWHIDSSSVLIVIAILSALQVMMVVMRQQQKFATLTALCVTTVLSLIYAGNVRLIEWLLADTGISQAQAMNLWYLLGIVCMVVMSSLQLIQSASFSHRVQVWYHKLYVFLLNLSQPHPKTITVLRQHYQY